MAVSPESDIGEVLWRSRASESPESDELAMLDMFIGGFRAPDYGHFKGICMSVALWIVLLVCVLWIALSEMPAGWDGHLPLPYLIALTPLLWIPTLAIAIAGAAGAGPDALRGGGKDC